jgi:hypothetical protein
MIITIRTAVIIFSDVFNLVSHVLGARCAYLNITPIKNFEKISIQEKQVPIIASNYADLQA